MSDRDQQIKQNKNSTISSSMHARVNTGQNIRNKSEILQMNHTGGSTNNPDERLEEHSSFLKTFLFYVLTGVFAAIYIIWVMGFPRLFL